MAGTPGWKETPQGVEFPVRVRPGAPRNAAGGRHGEAVKVAVTAPAQDGKANAAVVKLLAKVLGVAKGDVELVSGQKARDKRVRVAGLTAAAVRARLEA